MKSGFDKGGRIRGLFVAAALCAAIGCVSWSCALAVPAAEIEAAPATDYYTPMYYYGYPVCYDELGRPYYYHYGVVYFVPVTYAHYGLLVRHYQMYRAHYWRWYRARGFRYRYYRHPGYHGGHHPGHGGHWQGHYGRSR